MSPAKDDPRIHRVVVKMNHADLAVLDALRGDVGRGPYLRALMLNRQAVTTAPQPGALPHRHRPGPIIAERYVQGQRMIIPACIECGTTLRERRA
jgi:hypothetical protein